LHESEINSSISSFFDSSWFVRLGDEMNGWEAEALVGSWDEAERWLDEMARRLHPRSQYARGAPSC
jgi:hypothetical protein